MAETLLFSRLKAFFMGYRLFLGFLGDFEDKIGPDTGLRVMAENLTFSPFRDVFISYRPQFQGSGAIHKARETRYMFESHG